MLDGLLSVLRWRWLLYAVAAVLFAYVVLRSLMVGMTYDEICSLEFKDLHWYDFTSRAQIHLLNALTTHWAIDLFGSSALSIRLASTLACLLYLGAALGLSADLTRRMGGALFILLVLNPFVIDLFSLSRGYACGLSFMLAAVFLTLRFQRNGSLPTALAAVLCGALSVVSSYTQMHVFLPLLLVLAWCTLDDPRPIGRRSLRAAALLLPAVLFLAWMLPVLFGLKERGEFYFGGRDGFWVDTVGSMGRCFGYHATHGPIASQLYMGLFVGATVLAVRRLYFVARGAPRDAPTMLAILLVLAIASAITQFVAMSTPLPVERTALFYYPLVALNLVHGLGSLPLRYARPTAGVVGSLAVLHFLSTANLTHCYSWRYDAGSRPAIEFLSTWRRGDLRVGIDYMHAPSMGYYRQEAEAHWLTLVQVSGCFDACLGLEELKPAYFGQECKIQHYDKASMEAFLAADPDVYYLDRSMLAQLDRNAVKYTVLKSFPPSRASLITLEPRDP